MYRGYRGTRYSADAAKLERLLLRGHCTCRSVEGSSAVTGQRRFLSLQHTQHLMSFLRSMLTRQSKSAEVHGVRLGAGDNSFLIREDAIEVLRNEFEGLKTTDTTFKVKTEGKPFTPSRVMLMEGEGRMNMLSPLEPAKLFHTDIESQKVVSEWRFQKDSVDIGMLDFANDTRSAQLEDSKTFLGIAPKMLVRWDMRAPEGVVQSMSSPSVLEYSQAHAYGHKAAEVFSCIATSGNGDIVVGSEDGKIRMFDGTMSSKNAKSTVDASANAITAIDISFDGKWILATTKGNLVVVQAIFKDKSGKEVNGFKKSISSTAPACLLKLKEGDQPLLENSPLKNGRFTWVTEAGREEHWIVASCGNYTLKWNFRQVKLAIGKLTTTPDASMATYTEYQKYDKKESVVDSAFMNDKWCGPRGSSSVVVATKHKVDSLAD